MDHRDQNPAPAHSWLTHHLSAGLGEGGGAVHNCSAVAETAAGPPAGIQLAQLWQAQLSLYTWLQKLRGKNKPLLSTKGHQRGAGQGWPALSQSVRPVCYSGEATNACCKEHTRTFQEPGYLLLHLPRSPSLAEEKLLELGLVTHREARSRCSSMAKSSLKSCIAPKGQNSFLKSSTHSS